MASKSIMVFAGLALIASPAVAAEQSASKARPPEKTYCFQFALDTGSRINRTECKTKREWALVGVDVDELLAK